MSKTFPDITIPGWFLDEDEIQSMLDRVNSYIEDCGADPEVDEYRDSLINLLGIHQRTTIEEDNGLFVTKTAKLN